MVFTRYMLVLGVSHGLEQERLWRYPWHDSILGVTCMVADLPDVVF